MYIRLVVFCVLFCCVSSVFAQNVNVRSMNTGSLESRQKIVDDGDTAPVFMGGDIKDFIRWVNSRIVYPKKAIRKGIEGRVVVTFVIDKDGSVLRATARRTVDPILDRYAERLVKGSPRWEPGRNRRGLPITYTYHVPVDFVLPRG